MGKSSVLHALQVSLGAFLQCLPIPASPVYRRQFRPQERFVRWNDRLMDYEPNPELTSITTVGILEKEEVIEWTRTMLKSNTTSHNRVDTGRLIRYVDSLVEKRKHQDALFPIVASFGTERTNAQLRKGKSAQLKRGRLEKAYLGALSPRADFNGVLEWLHNYDTSIKYKREFEGTREAVFETIELAIPYLDDIDYNALYGELEAFVKIDDVDLGKKTHSNMSDGLIAMLNLVAELAFRCVILNGFLGKEAIRATTGIVLIDELDMHLHPKWQRHVVSDLKKAFPNIQFVVTTHSPFIVQSLDSDELYNLDKYADIVPKDLKIDDIATLVMGVESPFSDKNQEQYQQARSILEKLNFGISENEISDDIESITDPGLRAFMEMNKLAKGNKK
ncbi:hypothetical protein D3C73_779240 [compost metagenome]